MAAYRLPRPPPAGIGEDELRRRERTKRRTRRALLRTALRLFLEQGYEQTTAAETTETADVAPPH